MKTSFLLALSAATVSLSGCAKFAWVLEDETLKTMKFGHIVFDRGVETGSVELQMTTAQISGAKMNPTGRLVVADFLEFFSQGLDSGIFVAHTEGNQIEAQWTDNTFATLMATACDPTTLDAAAADYALDYVSSFIPAPYPPYSPEWTYIDRPTNTISSLGWSASNVFVASADLEVRFSVSINGGPSEMIIEEARSGYVEMTRSATGSWDATDCFDTAPVLPPPPAQTRNITVGGAGELLLDGAPLVDTSMPPQPLETETVSEVVGPVR